MSQRQVLLEALERMKNVTVSEHPAGALVLKSADEMIIVMQGDQGWRLNWPSGTTQDFLDLTTMVHVILRWQWDQGGE